MMLFVLGCTEEAPQSQAHALISDGLVVSQVYGGGGNPGADWHNDYVELFNRGSSTLDLNGWSLQYGSANANLNLQVNISVTASVAPGRYYLISLGSSGSHGASVPADLVGSGSGAFNISNADGKVALVSSQTALGCGGANRCASASIIDLVGYGEGSDYEGTAALSPVGVNGALYRTGEGCVDSDDNSADFLGGTAVPRNLATAFHSCSADLAGVDSTPGPDLLPEPDLAGGDLAVAEPAVGGRVVISQLYGAGGDSGASFRNDFVELYNRSLADEDVSDWSLQYASKDNTFALEVDLPAGTLIPAGGYFLIRLSSGGGSGATVADPDLTVNMPDVLNISATAGKLALVDRTALQVCGTAANRCSSSHIIDLVGYGVASDYEGTPAASFGSTPESLFRKQDGCQDSDHNDRDFFSAAANPRNSGTPIQICTPTDAGIGPDDGSTAHDASIDAAADGSLRDGSTGDGSAHDASVADAAVPDDASAVQLTRDLSGGPRTSRADSGCGCELGGAPDASDEKPGLFALVFLLLFALRVAVRSRQQP